MLLLCELGVFGEEWRVRWQQRGLGFMKSINHGDSTTLYLSSSPSVTGNFKCQVFLDFGAKCLGDSQNENDFNKDGADNIFRRRRVMNPLYRKLEDNKVQTK